MFISMLFFLWRFNPKSIKLAMLFLNSLKFILLSQLESNVLNMIYISSDRIKFAINFLIPLMLT